MYNSGRRGKRTNDGYGVISTADNFNQSEYPIPTVTSFSITDGSYNPLPDSAVDTAGGQTIVVNGSGFRPGATVMVGGNTIGVVTYIDQGRLAFTAPALTSASYTIIVTNSNGGTGILVPGLVYSGLPTWSTSAGSVGSVYETKPISQSFVATGDAPLTYALYSGSIPSGSTLESDGTLSGTAPADSGSTTYSFTIRAYDAQNQHSDRSFSLTINTDTVTWSTPTNNQVITAYEYTPITNVTASATSAAGYGVLYTANATPTGITIDANTGLISGTANTVGNTYTQLTATANTTVRNATRNVVFNVNQDVVTWSSPADQTAYSLVGGSAMANVTLSATSAAGRSITYTANALPSGVGLSGSVIYGTPDSAQTVTTLLTATAATTNRSATRTISWSVSLGDSNWKNTTLLLNGVSSTTPFIQDSSLNNAPLTIFGDTRPSNYNPYREGYYSNLFDSSKLAVSGSGLAAFGTGDFTLEMWVKLSSDTSGFGGFYDSRTNGSGFFFGLDNGNEKLMYYISGAVITDTDALVIDQWYHVALVRYNGTTKIYKNGVSVGTPYADTNNYTSTMVNISETSGTAFYGHISNLRSVAGTAVYTANFTPPTAPLTAIPNTTLLTCQSNRFIDKSNNNHTITTSGTVKVESTYPFAAVITSLGSAYFDGTGDYLRTQSLPGIAFGTGDFTIECWVYLMTGADTNASFFTSTPASTYNGIVMGRDVIGVSGPGGSGGNLFSVTLAISTWIHVALTRSGTSLRLFLNGVQTGSTTTNSTDINSTLGTIGSRYVEATGYLWTGYISDLRAVKGTALYTANFLPPQAPLTPVANTQLLTLQYNGGATNNRFVDQSSLNNIISRTGNATQGTFSPYSQTGWSTYFDGSSILRYIGSGPANFGTGDFTIEMWVNISVNTGTWQGFYDSRVSGTGFFFGLDSGGLNLIYYRGSILITDTTPLVLNRWYHVAIVRSSGTVKIYKDGVSVGTPYSDSTSYTSTTTDLSPSSGLRVNGYLSNVRVLKGTALYTTNFTPPTEPLAAIANTTFLTCQSNRFDDRSSSILTLDRSGSPTVETFSPFGGVTSVPTSYSNYFDGTGDRLAATLSTGLGSGDFTAECWVNFTSTKPNDVGIFQIGNSATTPNDSGIGIGRTGGQPFLVYNNTYIAGNQNSDYGVWCHVAAVRQSGTIRLYVNGVQAASVVNNTNYTQTNLFVGGYYDASSSTYLMSGYISNLRVVVGTAVYTSAFTPPTAPLTAISGTVLLTCQAPTMIDSSNNKFEITAGGDAKPTQVNPFGLTNTTLVGYSPSVNGGSMYFDGDGDRISCENIPKLGTNNYTIECWCRANSVGSQQNLLFVGGISLWTQSEQWRIYASNGGAAYINATIAFTPSTNPRGQWIHHALVRSGSTFRWFINGVQVYTTSDGNGYSLTTFDVSYSRDLGGNWAGHVSDVRYVKGAALYTSAFVPPVAPVTASSNTVLYLTGTSGGIVDAHATNTLETVGNVQLAPITPYTANTGGKSMYFDGTGDYLLIPKNPNLNLGASAYTVEAWFNIDALSGQQTIISFLTGLKITVVTTPALRVWGDAGNTYENAPATINPGTWYHMAWVRESTSLGKLYLNGSLILTVTSSNIVSSMPTDQDVLIGTYGDGFGNPFKGHIKDLRITKGVARYTSAFTPPTTTLVNK